MLVLAIETSTPVSSVALGTEQGIVASIALSRGRGHAEFLAPAIKSLCEQGDLSLSQLSGIAVGLGPGLFTGMRVGIATAKGLSQALSIPLVGIPSLDLLAYDVRYTPRTICACIDARRGEVFAALYRQVPGGIQRMSEYDVWAPERLAGELEAKGEEVLFVGNGALVYKGVLPRRRADYASVHRAFPSAVALLELSIPRFIREDTDSIHELEPLYLRKADVQIGWETRSTAMLNASLTPSGQPPAASEKQKSPKKPQARTKKKKEAGS
ncbi:MAG: tRNA (adenosine(37)-N6)-threonylcarbamoyltransferase complex dimerization subunit type 1 TsaB [Actinomycetota bacterium]